MSNLHRNLMTPSSSKPNSRVSSRSNSRAPTSRMLSSPTSNDSEDEEDFNFNNTLDDLIISKLNSYQSSIADSEIGEKQTNLNTHSIPDLFHSLSQSRTTVSTESRESLLARLYHLIISKPLVSQEGLVNEFDVENLIKYYQSARTENERLLTLKVMTTYCCSDIEEVSSLVISDLLPILVGELKEVESVSSVLRSNVMICYSSLLLCIYDGSGAYGLDDTLNSILELIEGLINSQEKLPESDVIINGLHTIGAILTLLYHGGNDINELIEDTTPRIVDFLENGDLNISKAAGRVIALFYELYDYGDYDEEEDDDFEQSPYYDYDNLHTIINSLSTTSAKNINKKLKKESKSVFRDILLTLDSYSSKDSREELLKNPLTLSHLKLSKSRSLTIQSWYSFIRLIHLRYIFNAGLHDNLLCNPDLSTLIKKPKLNDKFSKFDKNYDNEDDENQQRTFGLDQKRKISGKKKDIEINNARAEKVRKEMGDLSINP